MIANHTNGSFGWRWFSPLLGLCPLREPRADQRALLIAQLRKVARRHRFGNHGLLVAGKSIADTFLSMYTFEAACQIQISAQAGGELTQINPQIVQGVAEAMRVQTGGMGGAFVWPSLIRKLERSDQSYKL